MSKRARIIFFVIGIICLTAAGWIALNLDRFSYTDQSADIELVPPAGS